MTAKRLDVGDGVGAYDVETSGLDNSVLKSL
jgi:hypothetical protein